MLAQFYFNPPRHFCYLLLSLMCYLLSLPFLWIQLLRQFSHPHFFTFLPPLILSFMLLVYLLIHPFSQPLHGLQLLLPLFSLIPPLFPSLSLPLWPFPCLPTQPFPWFLAQLFFCFPLPFSSLLLIFLSFQSSLILMVYLITLQLVVRLIKQILH